MLVVKSLDSSTPMKLQFDSGQAYQLVAIAAVIDFFGGQLQAAGNLSVVEVFTLSGFFTGQRCMEPCPMVNKAI